MVHGIGATKGTEDRDASRTALFFDVDSWRDGPTRELQATVAGALLKLVGGEVERCPADFETVWAEASPLARGAGFEDRVLVRPNRLVLSRFIDSERGFGCFARRDLMVGEAVEFPGLVSAHEEGLERRNFCVDLGRRRQGLEFSVSPFDQVAAGYVNDGTREGANNVKFGHSVKAGRAGPVRVSWQVTKAIKKGEEVLGGYGAGYWKHWTDESGEQTAGVSAWVWRLVHELRGSTSFPIVISDLATA